MNQEDKYHALEDPYIDNWSGYDVATEMAEEDGHDWSTLSPEEKMNYLYCAGVDTNRLYWHIWRILKRS